MPTFDPENYVWCETHQAYTPTACAGKDCKDAQEKKIAPYKVVSLDELIKDTRERMTGPYDMPQWERWGLNARLSWLLQYKESIA